MSEADQAHEAKRLRQALLSRLNRRVNTSGELSFPAAPSLLPIYVERLTQLFASLGKALSAEELTHLEGLLAPRLCEGFASSACCRVRIKWESEPWPQTGLDYQLWLDNATLEQQYEQWMVSREPPLFGAHPDAKVMAVAEALAPRSAVLDIGAGTGRNTLPLAREGHHVSALELTEAFCVALEEAVQSEALPVKVLRGSAVGADLGLEAEAYDFALCSEVTTHFRSAAELRTLFERVTKSLRVGGQFLMNVFLADEGYEPDAMARELSQISWSTLFTRAELLDALAGLPLEQVSTNQCTPTRSSTCRQRPGPPPAGSKTGRAATTATE